MQIPTRPDPGDVIEQSKTTGKQTKYNDKLIQSIETDKQFRKDKKRVHILCLVRYLYVYYTT